MLCNAIECKCAILLWHTGDILHRDEQMHCHNWVVTPLRGDNAYRSETPPNYKYDRSNLSPSQDSYADNDAQTNNPQQAHANTDAPDGLVLVSCDVFGGA